MSVSSARLGCTIFKWRLHLFGLKLSVANIFRHGKDTGFPHQSQWSQALHRLRHISTIWLHTVIFPHYLCLSPPLFSSLLFFMASQGFFSTALHIFCAVSRQKKPLPIARIFPARTLTMRAPLSPTVVDVQLHFILGKKHVPQSDAPPGAPLFEKHCKETSANLSDCRITRSKFISLNCRTIDSEQPLCVLTTVCLTGIESLSPPPQLPCGYLSIYISLWFGIYLHFLKTWDASKIIYNK